MVWGCGAGSPAELADSTTVFAQFMFPPSSSLAARLSAVFFVLATFTAVVVPVTPAQSQIYPITFPIASGYEDQVTWSDTYGAPRSGGRTHIGVDLLGPKMIPLVAANDGVVTWGRFDNSRGTICLLYTSPSPRDATLSRMPSSA